MVFLINSIGMAGWRWYYGFMNRHRQLSLRTPEQTSLNRIKAFCKENVDIFFRNLDNVLTNIAPFQPHAIWNMDETGFSTVPSKIGKLISVKGMRRVGNVASQERGSMITMALAVSATGNTLPPFFLFPRKNMQAVFMENASPMAVGFANESGYMQQAKFVKYIEHFIAFVRPSKHNPALLLLDNHASQSVKCNINITGKYCDIERKAEKSGRSRKKTAKNNEKSSTKTSQKSIATRVIIFGR